MEEQVNQAAPGAPKSEKDNIIKLEGRVTEALPNAFFKVLLPDNREIMGFISGKMKLNRTIFSALLDRLARLL